MKTNFPLAPGDHWYDIHRLGDCARTTGTFRHRGVSPSLQFAWLTNVLKVIECSIRHCGTEFTQSFALNLPNSLPC